MQCLFRHVQVYTIFLLKYCIVYLYLYCTCIRFKWVRMGSLGGPGTPVARQESRRQLSKLFKVMKRVGSQSFQITDIRL